MTYILDCEGTMIDSGYLMRHIQELADDAEYYDILGECPRCKAAEEPLPPVEPEIEAMLDGVELYCVICGARRPAVLFVPRDQDITAKVRKGRI